MASPRSTSSKPAGVNRRARACSCTAVFNVPLNNALAAVDPASAEAAPLWARYLTDWTLWNHVRTIASTAACALFVRAIAVR